ncbi:MAG: methionyl-tRNA formyltransferase [Patescibacteria group bacterium]|nr:methionyl-tRNA formyltransferase [Patescibacteria group bacterium]MDD5164238.1 methionyl-tRNA formyltransferase [Patescibacteria group bacterium]MDD5534656.1 methionyl-tRNA formyltransferase [Patescibacteria group bacterium]
MNSQNKIIFWGTPEFGAIVLDLLSQTEFKPIKVITESDKPVGRKQILTAPPVKELALKYDIPVLQPDKILDSKFQILNSKPDLFIVAAYGKFLPKEILDIPKYGCLNIHPSLLPLYRGATPIQTAILNGDKTTGVSIILMDEKMDHGPIVAQQQLGSPIANYQLPKLSKELAELGAKLLIETLPKWMAGEIKPNIQDETKVTFTRQIKKEDGLIDWSSPAKKIEKMLRAYYPWPGIFTNFDNKKLKIIKADFLETQDNKKSGTVFLTTDKQLAVVCGENALILKEIQLEGKKVMNSKEFLNGYPRIIDSILN